MSTVLRLSLLLVALGVLLVNAEEKPLSSEHQLNVREVEPKGEPDRAQIRAKRWPWGWGGGWGWRRPWGMGGWGMGMYRPWGMWGSPWGMGGMGGMGMMGWPWFG